MAATITSEESEMETQNRMLVESLNNIHHQMIQSDSKKQILGLFYKLSDHYTYYQSRDVRDVFYNICITHPIDSLLLQDPNTRRSRQRPRGYAGDAQLIDFIYRIGSPHFSDTFLGREIFSTIMDFSSCESVRWRARHMADQIESTYVEKNKLINVLAIASGHLRELHYIQNFETKIHQFYALDQDVLSNEEARNTIPYANLQITNDSILSILAGKYKPEQPLDLIYSAGLFDYLNDRLATKLIPACIKLLAPGGKLIIANFVKGIVEQAYMEAFMDWHLIYRNEEDMLALITQETREHIVDHKMYRDPMGNVVYLEMRKG